MHIISKLYAGYMLILYVSSYIDFTADIKQE